MFGYRVPAPDEAMLISGRGGSPQGAPFRVVIGHGAFVTPVFRKVRYLTLSMQEAEVAETCVTKQGLPVTVRAVSPVDAVTAGILMSKRSSSSPWLRAVARARRALEIQVGAVPAEPGRTPD